jgi:hypothetical protein
MELDDPNIRQEFLTHVINLVPRDYRFEIDREVIEEYLAVRSYAGGDPFPIPLTELARWLYSDMQGKKFYNRRQYLKGKIEPKEGETFYVKGRDYRTELIRREGRTMEEYYLSGMCFADLCLRMNTRKSKALRLYHLMIDEAYREYAGETIRERRKHEDPEISLEKQTKIQSFDLPNVPMLYWDHINQTDPFSGEDVDLDKYGYTTRGNTRMQENNLKISRRHKLKAVHFGESKDDIKAAESILHSLLTDYRTPCQKAPCMTEVFQFKNPLQGKLAWQTAVESEEFAHKRYHNLLEQNGLEEVAPKNYVSGDAPKHFSFKTKRGGSKMVDLTNGVGIEVPGRLKRCPKNCLA